MCLFQKYSTCKAQHVCSHNVVLLAVTLSPRPHDLLADRSADLFVDADLLKDTTGASAVIRRRPNEIQKPNLKQI